ncbi:putative MFS-type transporter, partial [Lachnellula occidentalis]
TSKTLSLLSVMATLHDDVVPGTVHLVDIGGDMHTRHLDGNKEIVLVPKPSSDPEDPLNWTRKRKMLSIGMCYVYTVGIGISTAVQYSVLTQIAEDTGITVSQLNLGTGLMFLFLGWACLLWQPLALVYGRRGVYVASSFLSIWPVLWSAYSTSKGEWYAHRIILGIFASPVESLPRHLYGNLCLPLIWIKLLAPFFAGWIDFAGGWQWVMWFGAIVQALATIIIYFFMEETMYFRNTMEGVDTGALSNGASTPDETTTPTEKSEKTAVSPTVEGSNAVLTHKKTYWSKLQLFVKMDGRPSLKQLWTMMYRPLLIMYHFPCVTWAGFVYGTCLSWYNVLNATASSVLSAAPYNFSSGLVGTAYLSPFIGALLGAVWSGWSTDKFAIRLARRNSGVREPEQRLWALGASGILCAAGLILWGVGAARGVHWFGLIVGLGMLAFSVICGGSISLSYDVDCFKEIAGESMISVIVIRNTLGFAVSYGINPWINGMGLQNCFVTVAMVALACTFTFVPMIFFGKSLRKLSAKKYWEYVATSAAPSH